VTAVALSQRVKVVHKIKYLSQSSAGIYKAWNFTSMSTRSFHCLLFRHSCLFRKMLELLQCVKDVFFYLFSNHFQCSSNPSHHKVEWAERAYVWFSDRKSNCNHESWISFDK